MTRAPKPVLVAWSDDLAVGVPELDVEHRALIDAINDLWRLFAGAPGQTEFNYHVDRLITVTESHFANEEAVLERRGSRSLAAHRREHEELLEDLATFRLLGADQARRLSLSVMLSDWLLDHLRHFDRADLG